MDRVEQRRAATEAGHDRDEPAARALLAADDAGTRSAALGALARMGAATDLDVVGALGDPDPVVRRRAVEIAIARPTVPMLGLLGDPDDSVVEQAAWACGERTPPESGAVEALADLAGRHHDPLVREAAVAALGAIGDPAGLAAILAATGDRATVRRRAVIALAPFDGPEVERALRDALTDRDWQVRQAAEDQLGADPSTTDATP